MMSISATNAADLAALPPGESAPAFVPAALDEGLCGFLTVVAANPTYARVHANSYGTFRWVFSRDGVVTSISDYVTLTAGQEWEATCALGETIGVNCGD